jgi:hypothetical protein
MLLHLDGELKALAHRQDQLDQQLKAALAMGWDHVALARRLAVIEDHLDELLSRDAASDRGPLPKSEVRPSIRYPDRDDPRADGPRHLAAPQSKVS